MASAGGVEHWLLPAGATPPPPDGSLFADGAAQHDWRDFASGWLVCDGCWLAAICPLCQPNWIGEALALLNALEAFPFPLAATLVVPDPTLMTLFQEWGLVVIIADQRVELGIEPYYYLMPDEWLVGNILADPQVR